MTRFMPRTCAIALLLAFLAGWPTGAGTALGQGQPATQPPRPTPPPPPQQQPNTPRTPTDRDRTQRSQRQTDAYVNQLRQAAERRKLRLEEATARADEFVRKARKLNDELAGKPGGENYRALCGQLLHMGTDLQAMVERLRASHESPIFRDQELKSDSEHTIAMDNLLAAIIRALREAERMSSPVEVLATR